jgi:diguanylate cyclase (GGDEF)-like protein
LRENVRASDLVFRYGGDEFLILMPETEVEPKQAVGRLKRAVEEWSKEKQAMGFDLRLGLSIGAVSWSPKEGRSPSIEELLDSADRLLYREKHGSER